MNFELKNFQQKIVKEISSYLTQKLVDKEQKTIIFQSPTGSGKTLMMSTIIKQLLLEESGINNVCFLWISVNKGGLPEQSYKTLNSVLSNEIKCSLLEQSFFGSRQYIENKEVVIINWEKINSKNKEDNTWTNFLMKDKETYNFIDVLNNTKENGTKIILIIDESHIGSNTNRAKEIRDEIISPHITIEMSATPKTNADYDILFKVNPTDVITEGLIKKEILINPDIDKIADDDVDSETVILEAAYKKQQELKELYQKEQLQINPLVLIQLPDKSAINEDAKKDFIINFLKTKDVTLDNGRLAIWLNEEKVNNEKPFLIPNESNVDFLIFKQAIDTGWDCPRASILVKFREIKSKSFEIQTVGRILRTPEGKHYDNEQLNKGYIYTNLKSIIVEKETYNPNIIKTLYSVRPDINNFSLCSYYKNRISFNDLTSSFYKIFEKEFCKFFNLSIPEHLRQNKESVKDKLIFDNIVKDDEIILNGVIESKIFDILSEVKNNKTTNVKLSANDKSNYVSLILKEELSGFGYKRSINILIPALMNTFNKYFDFKNLNNNPYIYFESFILNNETIIRQVINKAIEAYKPIKLIEDEQKANAINFFDDKWVIPKTKNYNPNTYEKVDYNFSLHSPCYLLIDRSDPEKHFIEFLEQQNNIKWWWKNGDEQSKENFGIKKPDNYTFQPDFIVQFTDGKIGIYDTKSVGFQEDDTKIKAEVLQQYIENENNKGRNLTGGIIIFEKNHIKINNKKQYNSYKIKPEDWDFF